MISALLIKYSGFVFQQQQNIGHKLGLEKIFLSLQAAINSKATILLLFINYLLLYPLCILFCVESVLYNVFGVHSSLAMILLRKR